MNRTMFCRGTAVTLLLLSGSAGIVKAQPVLLNSRFYSGPSDQFGTGIAVGSDGVYLSGGTSTNASLAVKYGLSPGVSPIWAIAWPGVNSSAEVFNGVTVTSEGAYYSGQSNSQTTDNIGAKEPKGVFVKFPFSGATGPSTGGANWVAKPSFFPGYQGYEQLSATTFNVEAGQNYLYASGTGQANGANNTAALVKYDTSGTQQWITSVGNTGVNRGSAAGGITALNNNIYLAGSQSGAGSTDAMLWKYDTSGNAVWSKTYSVSGGVAANAVTGSGSALYLTGTIFSGANGGNDVFFSKYDEFGNLIWNQTWGGSANDTGNGITFANNHLYVVGGTSSFGAGGSDSFLLDVDPLTGSLYSNTFFGGAQDEIAHGIASSGNALYVVGESKSFDATPGRNDMMLLQYTAAATPEPGGIAFFSIGTLSLACFSLQRRKRRKG